MLSLKPLDNFVITLIAIPSANEKLVDNFKDSFLPTVSKATPVRGVTLTAAHLGSYSNFAQLPSK